MSEQDMNTNVTEHQSKDMPCSGEIGCGNARNRKIRKWKKNARGVGVMKDNNGGGENVGKNRKEDEMLVDGEGVNSVVGASRSSREDEKRRKLQLRVRYRHERRSSSLVRRHESTKIQLPGIGEGPSSY
ncbi:hypothetical protein V2J09_004393 [Rumex salicifolius]